MSLPLIYTAGLFLVTMLAMTRGGWAARRVALACLAAQVALLLAPHHRYHQFEAAFFVIDAALLGGLLWISLRSQVRWPMVLAALQLITVLGEIAPLIQPMTTRMTYWVLVQWTAWPMLLMIMMGILLDRRAARISVRS